MSNKTIIEELEQDLKTLHQNHFETYIKMDKKTADYYLFLGKCSGIDEALDLISVKYQNKTTP